MRLILLRHAHAKHGGDDPPSDDHDRPLNDRGRRDAPRIGAWLRERPPPPDRVLCSDARRTLETWEHLGLPGAVEARADLYQADPQAILAALPDEGCALLIAHNPGIGGAAERFAAARADHSGWRKFPTAACAILDFDGPARWGGGRVVAFTIPSDLN